MISANGGLPAHRYTPQVTQRWPRVSEPASASAIFMLYLFRSTDDVSLSLIPLVHVVDQEETGYGVGH